MRMLQSEVFSVNSILDLKEKLEQKLATAGFIVINETNGRTSVQLANKQKFYLQVSYSYAPLGLGINNNFLSHGGSIPTPVYPRSCLFACFDNGTFVFTQPDDRCMYFSATFYINSMCIGGNGIFPAVHSRETSISNSVSNNMIISYSDENTIKYSGALNTTDTGISMPLNTIHAITQLPPFYTPIFYYDGKIVGTADDYIVCRNTNIFQPLQTIFVGGKKYIALFSDPTYLAPIFFAHIEDE